MFQRPGDIEGLQYLCPFSDSGISVVEGACDGWRIFAIFPFLLLVPFFSF